MNMVDPLRAFREDSGYSFPNNPFVEYPSLLLLVVGSGILLWFISPTVCVDAFSLDQCITNSQKAGLLIAVLGLIPYVLLKFRDRH